MSRPDLLEKVGELKDEARHVAVMFQGSDISTFLHEFGEFFYCINWLL